MAINILKWIVRMLPISYIVMIWLQSSLFNPDTVEAAPQLGSVLEMGHLILFGILYVFIYLAWMTYGEVTTRKEVMIFIFTLLCALGDEMHQYYVPYRSATLEDLAKNVVGIIVAWFVIRMISRGRIKSTRKI